MLKRALSVVVSLFLWTPGYAQTLGTITGEVKDSSGASIPGSTVTAQNVATNAVRTQASNNAGAFTFPALPPGVYLVKAELEGFKPAENRVELHVEQTLRVSFALEIGGITETTLVTAVTPLLTTENATVGTVIENRRIVELPLNGRNYLSLIALSPNVSAGFAGAGQAGDRQGGSRANQQISISGQRREFNYYTLDGVDNTDVNFNTYIFLPSVDALEEFKVQTGIYSAEFGRAAGQVNVVTKSGSNAFHGTVFEFHRNEKFDARPYAFTAAQAAAPKPDFRWHQFGYTANGPVARNRLFFMSNWEGYKDDKTFLTPFTVPTVAMRSGDFSAYAGQLLDPATCAVAGGVRSCQPFAGNRIPSNRIAPTSQELLEFYPEPNAAGTQNNYIAQQDRVIDRKQYTQRMDFIQSTKSLWMGRYSWSHDDEVTPALKLNGSKLLNTVHQGMIGNTYTISPTVLNEARFGYNSFYNTFGRELAFVRDVVTELGIPGISAGPPESWGIPAIGITGFSGFGDSTEGPYTNRNKVFEFTDNLSWFRGKHSFKLGGTLRFDQYNQVGNQFSRGSFAFDGRATGSATGVATSGAPAFADFLLGNMRTAESAVALATTNFRATSQAYYFTDTWRVREDMTLDLGVRYEYVPPWLDKGGTLINAYLPYNDTGLPVADLSRHPVLVRIGEGDFYEDSPIRFAPNIQVSRNGELGGRLVDDDKLNFAPRVGWAWTPSAQLVGPRRRRRLLHAGHRQPALRHGSQRGRAPAGHRRPAPAESELGRAVPRVWHQRVRRSAAARLRGEPLRARQLVRPQDAVHGAVRVQRAARAWPRHGGGDRLSRLAQPPAGAHVRRQRGDARARQPAGPAAVSGVHQDPGDRQRGRGPLQLDGAEAHAAARPGAVLAGRLHALEVRGQRQRHPCPQRRRALPAEQQLLRVRMGAVDLRRPAPLRDVGALRAAVRAGQAVGDGRRGRRGAGRVADQRDREQVERLPARSAVGRDVPNTGSQTYRPNLVAGQDPNDGAQTVQQWFNTAAFARPDAFTYGNAGRNIVVGPGIFSTDASIMRTFFFGGTKSLQFRLEAFNAFNNPVWGDPQMSMASPLYGTINTTRIPMRELQIGLKFAF